MSEIVKVKCTGICGEIKELTTKNFTKRKDNKSGFKGRCKNCENKGSIIIENGIKYRFCTGKCGLKKELNEDNFGLRNRKKGIFRADCKVCRSEYNAKYGEKNKEKLTQQSADYYAENREEILLQQKEHRDDPENKIIQAKKSKKYRDEHKEEIKIKGKNYYEENKEEISLKEKIWREENREEYLETRRKNAAKNRLKIRALAKKHYKKHKQKILEQNRLYRARPEVKAKNREKTNRDRKENPRIKIRHTISVAIRKALKKRGISKTKSVSKSLPYDANELNNHLENQFEWWMNWNNHGQYIPSAWDDNDPETWTWQIDHSKPESEFNYTSEDDREFKDCWSLDNLRPYSAKLNHEEGVRRTRHNKGNK